MKIDTLQLMMYAADLPITDKACGDCSISPDDYSTSLNLIKDSLLKKKTWWRAISADNKALYDAIKELISLTSPVYLDMVISPEKAFEIARKIINKYNLPGLSDIDGCYSLEFAFVIITQIKDFPGYSYPKVVEFYRLSNPDMSEMMIATIFTRKNSGYLCKAAFDFRDWWAKQKKPNNLMELFKMQVEISNKIEELRTRYNLPNFFTD